MIIKNISPYPKHLTSLNKVLMPGDECDLSEFTQKQRDDCIDLQEGFRKGDFICLGIKGKDNYNPHARLNSAKERLQKRGALQPLVPIVGGDRANFEPFEVNNPTHTIEHSKGPFIERRRDSYEDGREKVSLYRNGNEERPSPPKKIEGFITERDKWGMLTSRPIPIKTVIEKPEQDLTQDSTPIVESPTITPERMREIIGQRCISFCTNGRKCKRWAVVGYEYCITHMPKDLLEEYKSKKKQQFFKD